MIKYVIITATVTLIIVVGIVLLMAACYEAGKQQAQNNFEKINEELRQSIREYQEQVAELRVTRKLAKKGGE